MTTEIERASIGNPQQQNDSAPSGRCDAAAQQESRKGADTQGLWSGLPDYDAPDGAWGDHEIEIAFQVGSMRAVRTVTVGGNGCGLDVMRSAIGVLFDQLATETPEDDPIVLKMCNARGSELAHELYDEEDLEHIAVGVRIVAFREDP